MRNINEFPNNYCIVGDKVVYQVHDTDSSGAQYTKEYVYSSQGDALNEIFKDNYTTCGSLSFNLDASVKEIFLNIDDTGGSNG